MPNECLIPDIRKCEIMKCEHCGWNREEAARRKQMVATNKFTICKGGIKKLIIKRKASEE